MRTEKVLVTLNFDGSAAYFPSQASLRNLVPPNAQYERNAMSTSNTSMTVTA